VFVSFWVQIFHCIVLYCIVNLLASVVWCFRCGRSNLKWSLYRQFTTELAGERILKFLRAVFDEVLRFGSLLFAIPWTCTAFTASYSCNLVHFLLTGVILLPICETMHHQCRVTVKKNRNTKEDNEWHCMTLQKTWTMDELGRSIMAESSCSLWSFTWPDHYQYL